MKKILAILLTLLTVFCLFSCSDNIKKTVNTDKNQHITDDKIDIKDANKYSIVSIDAFYEGLARFKTKGELYGYLDVNGNVVIKPIYVDASNFKDGIARVLKHGKYGYIDTKGNFVIDNIYDSATIFKDGLALVKINNIQKYINREGETVYTFTGKESRVSDISNGFFWVKTKEELISGSVYTMSYYNEDGLAFLIENAQNHGETRDFSSFNEWGYAVIYTNSGGKMIDENGNILDLVDNGKISYIYNHYIGFSNYNGLYLYDYNMKKFIARTQIPYFNTFEDVSYDYNCRYLGSDYYHSTSGFLYDMSGRNIILKNEQVVLCLDNITAFSTARIENVCFLKYDETDCFAVVLRSSSNRLFYSLIDVDGNVLITPTNKCDFMYTYKGKFISSFSGPYEKDVYAVYPFISGLCKAQNTETGLFGFIDINGNWVIEPQYQNVTDFFEYGDDAYAVVNNLTIINSKGETIFTAVKAEE